MEPGQLARVLTDFFTTIDGELSLTKGDYFLLISVVDKIWCYGESRNKRGKFPSNHLHRVDTPNLNDDENLFISIAPFKGEQEGDLIFDQGEFIIGQQEIEPGWWSGYIDERSGVFPMSHVWLIDKTILKKSGNKKIVRKKVKVKTSLKAQLDEELDLTEGDIVTVIEILDDGWVRGVTSDGRTGTFPEAFVEYINDNIDYVDQAAALPTASVPNTSNYQLPIYNKWIESSSHDAFEEAAPSYDDLFPDTKKTNDNIVSKKNDNPSLHSLDVKPYAITLYPFKAQYQDELNFEANEIVELTRHIDLDWVEGIIENKKGMLPTSYVKIIVDCSEENRIDSNIKDEHDESIKNYINLEDESRVKVAYTFDAQMKEDLSVKEGEIVTIVKTINEGWVSVKNENGEIGLCPRGYLSDDTHDDPIDDFVVLRNDEKIINSQAKRISIQPHRPAPPTPAPGSIPLQKLTINEKSQLHDEDLNKLNDNVNEDEINLQKRFEKRQNVISELVITEKEYVRDLKVTYETFNLYDPSKLETRGIDVSILFGNILDVIHVAEDLLDSMLKAMKGKDESQQMIAPCFLNMSERLKTIYKKYCGNHEAALSLLKKYEDNKEIMTLFDKGIETLRHQVACFDMSSILIKPVQRILKYPLMLYELVKCTEENHPDRENIEEAWKVMTAVASYINEYKRRTDIISKYLDSDNTLMSKMSKLNMHSVTKKSSRFSAKLSASFGLTNIPPDPVFDELEKQFKILEKTTEQLHYDVEQCMSCLHEETVCSEVLSDFLNQYHHEPLPQPRQQLSQQYSNDIVDYPSNSIDYSIKEEIKNDLINLDSPVKEKNNPPQFSQSHLYGNLDPLVDDDCEASSVNNQQQRYANFENEFYVVAYTFDGTIPGTLAIKKGQMVKLIKPHDEKGNDDWWLMEDRHGSSGYVPKNYVKLYSKP
ncbi:hypothetical protein HCN44_008356 [Aphidius gifuensis]|uniref:Dynamin-binding protein n=1 Tax=Aphidius gifuensis TaxID=684658 RepID=A0A834XMQ3_APHGI|nr:hypothetical protein HCN44_008356 [Aphidius gifuensis]